MKNGATLLRRFFMASQIYDLPIGASSWLADLRCVQDQKGGDPALNLVVNSIFQVLR